MRRLVLPLLALAALAGCYPATDKMLRIDNAWHELSGCIDKITPTGLVMVTPQDVPVTVTLYPDRDVLATLSPGECVTVVGFVTAEPDQFIGRNVRGTGRQLR